MKYSVVAYVLWCLVFLGFASIHRFYAGKWVSGLIWLLTGGLLLFGQVIDLILIPGMIREGSTDQENRRLTTLRKEAGQARTRLVNKIKHMVRRHNLQWEMPTKRLPSKSAIAWLKQLVLPRSIAWRWITCSPTWSRSSSV